MTRKDKLLGHLKRGWVSPLDALRLCGLLSCSQRVSELIREGHKIEKRWAKSPTGACWREYRLAKRSPSL